MTRQTIRRAFAATPVSLYRLVSFPPHITA
jgi:hypothetical protein